MKAEWQATGASTIFTTFNDTGPGTCQTGVASTIIVKHRIVEIVPYDFDDVGAWKYPI